jgi:hypothetical protein
MPFVLRPFRRFPVPCAVTYNAGSCIDAPITASGHDIV